MNSGLFDVDVIAFIQDVKQYPELYNGTEIINQNEINTKWESIGKKYGVTGVVCQKTWDSLYSSYVREKDKNEAITGNEFNGSITNAMRQIVNESANVQEKPDSEANDNNNLNTSTNSNKNLKGDKCPSNYSEDWFKCIETIVKERPFKLESDSKTIEKHLNKKKRNKISGKTVTKNDECIISNEDNLFGQVLLSMLKKLPIKERNEAKLDIFLLVTKLQNKHLNL